MPVEIIPKKPPKLPLWFDILFYLSIGLLLVSLAGFFILGHLQKKAEKTDQDLEDRLAEEKTPEEISLEEEIFGSQEKGKIGYQEKINDFSILIDSHKAPLNFFSVLEKVSHPKVQFTNFSLNLKESKVVLFGKAESFQTLGQQILILKQENLIKAVNLSKISLGKEGEAEFTFTLSLSLDPRIFK